MLDKMKQLIEMQGKMQEMKRQLDEAMFDIASNDGVVKITMNGSQELLDISIQGDIAALGKERLEKALKDTYNRAIKRSRDLAAQKLKEMTGFNIPGIC